MPTNAAAWNDLGVAYQQAGQWSNAVASYGLALRCDRELLDTRFNLGCLWLEQTNFSNARSEFFSYTSRRPNDAAGWAKLGVALLGLRDFAAAEKSFQRAVENDAGEPEALNGLGLIQVERKQLREAADSFAALAQAQPGYRPALLNGAATFQRLGENQEAIKLYRLYLALEPHEPGWETVQRIVWSLEPPRTELNLQPSAASAEPAPRVLASAPMTPVKTTVSASVETQSSRTATEPVMNNSDRSPAGSSAAKPATSIRPAVPSPKPESVASSPKSQPAVQSTPVASTNSGRDSTTTKPANAESTKQRSLLSRLNPFQREAKPAAKPAVRAKRAPKAVGPGRYPYWSPAVPPAGNREAARQAVIQGQTAQRSRKIAEAVQWFSKATQLDGSYFEAQYLLGLAAYQLRSYSTSAEAWENALAIRPDSADARYNFALTLKAAGYTEDAVVELEKLLAVHPDEARGHLTLGNIYAEKLGQKGRARSHYQQVLRLDPRNPQAQTIRYWLAANPG